MTPLERADAAIRRFGPWHHFPVREWKQFAAKEAKENERIVPGPGYGSER